MAQTSTMAAALLRWEDLVASLEGYRQFQPQGRMAFHHAPIAVEATGWGTDHTANLQLGAICVRYTAPNITPTIANGMMLARSTWISLEVRTRKPCVLGCLS